ncbi:DNA-binding NtrC family response regulator [Haloferula luteola]|uniref:DNA-binding NtrC family response regulator n=1 Tax=Haloferula luteola TaxID=595692 RepID=A0A840VDT8_9BACT|nr:hypothetical protein [Haloferula luteola]MBB5353674.1 DNA-binding NtrC family response regulator [Haloferula luteola]
MSILLIEDDQNKVDRVCDFLKQSIAGLDVDLAGSFNSGIRSLLSKDYEALILDMTLPMVDISTKDPSGYKREHFGGRLVLREMKLRDVNTPTIVLTQFDQFGDGPEEMTLEQLDGELAESFPFYKGSIFYSASHDTWAAPLLGFLNS